VSWTREERSTTPVSSQNRVHPISLAEARVAAALSLADLALEANVSIQTLWRIEHGKTHPLPRVRRAVAKAVGVRSLAHIAWPRRLARTAPDDA
jgi:transcriptional regulator with XRE-family HTH domain